MKVVSPKRGGSHKQLTSLSKNDFQIGNLGRIYLRADFGRDPKRKKCTNDK